MFLLLLVGLVWGSGTDGVTSPSTPVSAPQDWELKPERLNDTRNVHRAGPIWLAGQPSQETFDSLKSKGIKTVVTLREEDELAWDDQELVESKGLTFVPLRFASPDKLSDEIFAQSRELLRAADPDQGVLLHCASANRVGAIWLAFRILDGDMTEEEAKAEAAKVGLRSEGLRRKTLDYVHRQRQDSP